MSTSFNRNRAQLRCESFFNCSNLTDWEANCSAFKQYVLTIQNVHDLQQDLIADSVDFYYKGILSMAEGIHSVNANLFSWATVKLYYSVYYFLRASLSVKGYAVVRNRTQFLVHAKAGESPVWHSNRKYNSTHQGTIHFYKDTFSSDKLLTNSIDGTDSYLWLMEKRDQINYRERSFNDPSCSDFWQKIHSYVNGNIIGRMLKEFFNDQQFLYCFQEDHAALALPIKRAILTKEDFDCENIEINLSHEQVELIRQLLNIEHYQLECFLELLS